VDQELPRHEKIRFRRHEITNLGALPSACTVPPLGQAAIGRGFRILARTAFAAIMLAVVLVLAVYAIGASGIGSERLRATAEKAIEDLAGIDVNMTLGPARITLDGSSFLALEVGDVSLKTADGKPMVDAASMRFGVRFLPLLSGEVHLTSARIADAHISLGAMPAGDGDWAAHLRNADGLLDPDKVSAAVFDAVREALGAVRRDSLREIGLTDVEFALPAGAGVQTVHVASATVSQTGPGKMDVAAEVAVDGRALSLKATAVRDPATSRISSLSADVTMAPPASRADAKMLSGGGLGEFALHLTGSEGGDDADSRLAASLSLAHSALDLGKHGVVAGDLSVDASLTSGTNKISLDRLLVKTGRSAYNFAGSIGPKPRDAAAGGEEPSYRYDITSDGSTLAPEDSPEPALAFLARIAGEYRTESRKLVADTIALRSGPTGEVRGDAAVAFVAGEAPGVSLDLSVHDMPVSHVKQLWPWFSAHGARTWVLQNLFGGRVVDGNVQYHVAPGRAGNGVPLGPDEVFGRFRIDGSRFDTAGTIPPVRDAVGAVEFHGNSVDITLDSGSVYMPSGRVVAASNGILKVRNANEPPVVGALDIDVEGDAPAIAELASYEPINAMRHVGMVPEDLSGTVKGNVKADIPLQHGVDTSKLGFLVSLDYRDLALAKPVDGQMVTEADGTIVVDPDKALVEADAKLNGIPAEIDITEPLEDSGPPRSRKVLLVIDDKTRNAVMPGLSTLLSGTVKVALDKNDDGSQAVSADLTAAKLMIPWAGWSKGASVPADVTFTMKDTGATTTLSDFDLSGKSFQLDGKVVLSGGRLVSADFDRVRLNRGDDVAVSVKHSAKAYAVSIDGDALDARPLIKQFMSDSGTASTGAGSDPITVSANVGSLTGFHDEKLSNLTLNYSTASGKAAGLQANATTSAGAAFTVSDTGGQGRSLSMKSADAGAVLRFLDIYEHMQGGAIALALSGSGNGPLTGTIDARNFLVVNEPKLASIVSTRPANDTRSLNQAVKGDIDTSRVSFERGYSEVEKGAGYLKLKNGLLRGPTIGTTFQGTLYDQNNDMDMTGTFMPIYGLNRIFGELPLVGALLGNGRDRGLIGVTFRLRGNANKPVLDVNPLSVIAPGIFRSIFEFR